MLSHVLRPMMTVFAGSCSVSLSEPLPSVTVDQHCFPILPAVWSSGRKHVCLYIPRWKYFISPGKRHGRPPFLPIPLDRVAATTAVTSVILRLASGRDTLGAI